MLQRVEAVEEAFSCFLVHRSNHESERLHTFQQELQNALSGLPAEQQELAVKQYLSMAVNMTNHSRLQLLFGLLENLVASNTLSAR